MGDEEKTSEIAVEEEPSTPSVSTETPPAE